MHWGEPQSKSVSGLMVGLAVPAALWPPSFPCSVSSSKEGLGISLPHGLPKLRRDSGDNLVQYFNFIYMRLAKPRGVKQI